MAPEARPVTRVRTETWPSAGGRRRSIGSRGPGGLSATKTTTISAE